MIRSFWSAASLFWQQLIFLENDAISPFQKVRNMFFYHLLFADEFCARHIDDCILAIIETRSLICREEGLSKLPKLFMWSIYQSATPPTLLQIGLENAAKARET